MKTGYKWLAILTAMTMLAGCGGGGKDLSGGGTSDGGTSDGGSDDGSTTTGKISLTLMSCSDISDLTTCTDASSLPAERANLVEVQLVDSQNKPLADEIVSVSTDFGSIKISRKQTDSSGIAYFELNADSSTAEGAGIITATYDANSAVTATQNFSFVPGEDTSDTYQLLMTLMSCNDLSDESSCVETRDLPTERASLVNVTLLSPAGEAVDGAIITANATQGAIQPSSSRLTNSEGKTSFLLTAGTDSADKAGTFTVAAAVEGENVSASETYQFGASDLKISLSSDRTSLPVGSVAVLTATVTLNDAPYPSPLTVTFNSSCAGNNKATLDSSVTTQQGIATATYKGTTDDYACDGSDTITASVTGADQPAQVVIDNQAAAIRSITAATPSPEFIYIRGSGKGEKATVTFTVKDEQDKPVSGKQLDFAFGTLVSNGENYQDYTLSPTSATTNTDGQATVTVNAGTIPVPLRVIATLHDDAQIRAASSQIGVGVGYADDNSVSLSAEKFNIEGWNYDGETTAITIRLADRFNNPVPDGTKVYFTTEGGSVAGALSSDSGDTTGVCSSVAGVCTATLSSQQPRPRDGRVTVTAYVEGEESFFDVNGNGLFDQEDFASNDIGEVFSDLNVDDTPAADADVDGFRLGIDTFIDINGDGLRNLGDGKYTGLLCSQAAKAAGICVDALAGERTFVNLFRNAEFIFSGVFDHDGASTHFDRYANICVTRKATDATAYAKLKQYECSAVDDNPNDLFIDVWQPMLDSNGNNAAVVDLRTQTVKESDGERVLGTWLTDFTTADANSDNQVTLSEFLAVYPNSQSIFAMLDADVDGALTASEAATPLTTTPAAGYVNFTPSYVMADGTENPMPAGSTFSVTTTNGGDLTPTGTSYESPYPSTTRPIPYGLYIGQEATANKKTSGNLSITITSPRGEALTTQFTVLDNG